MRELLLEIYQIIFIFAICYILNVLFSFFIKAYGYFMLKKDDVTYNISTNEKIMLWIAISIFLSHLIN